MADDRAGQSMDPEAEWTTLGRFLAGECDAETAQTVRDGLALDAERAALVDALNAALTLPAEAPLPDHEVEAALRSVLARRDGALPLSSMPMHASEGRSAWSLPRARVRWRDAALRAAAAVVVVAGASALWRSTRADPSTRTSAVAATTSRRATGIGQIDSLRLDDGTRVVLGPASALTIGDRFGQTSRDVTVEGEAYFDVVHDATKPFVVHAAHATLRDVGTSFTVRTGAMRGTLVSVTSGVVDVRALTGAPATLRAGDRAVVDDEVHAERGVELDGEMAWTRGSLVFREATLPEVAAGLRRWFGLELVVGDTAIAARRLTATFDRGMANEVGSILAAALGASVERSGDTLRLSALRPPR